MIHGSEEKFRIMMFQLNQERFKVTVIPGVLTVQRQQRSLPPAANYN